MAQAALNGESRTYLKMPHKGTYDKATHLAVGEVGVGLRIVCGVKQAAWDP